MKVVVVLQKVLMRNDVPTGRLHTNSWMLVRNVSCLSISMIQQFG